MDAVDGTVVFVTEPLHAFEAEKAREGAGRCGAQNKPQGPSRPFGRDGSWTCRASSPLVRRQRSQGTEENHGWATRLSPASGAEAVFGYVAKSCTSGQPAEVTAHGSNPR